MDLIPLSWAIVLCAVAGFVKALVTGERQTIVRDRLLGGTLYCGSVAGFIALTGLWREHIMNSVLVALLTT